MRAYRVRSNWIIMICMFIVGAQFFIIGLVDAHCSLSAIRDLSPIIFGGIVVCRPAAPGE